MEAKWLSWWVGVILLFGMLALPQTGWAVLVAVEPVTPDELLIRLARGAERIVLGTVVATSSFYGPDREIYTDVTIRVEADLKNLLPPAEVVVTVQGGQIGNTRSWVSDEPTFTLDEQVVVFLLQRGPTWKVAGFNFGKVSIVEGQVLFLGKTMPVADFLGSVQQALQP